MPLPAQRRIFDCGEQCNVLMLNGTDKLHNMHRVH